MEAQSFTTRRPAASNLPQFQLPPPDHLSGMHKYPAYAPSTTQPAPPVSSVLTPPATLPNDNSPLSSINSGSSGGSGAGGPYQPMGYWPTPQNPQYTYSSAPPMSGSYAPAQPQQYNMNGRQLYSPSMNFPNRSTSSPATGEGLPPPPYDLPPFPTPMGSSGGPQQQSGLPNLGQQAQPQQQQQQQQGPPPPPQQMSNNTLINTQQPSSQAPPQGPLHAPDNYGGRPPPTPTSYYTPSSTPQQPSFPAYTQQSPTQQSPNTSSAPQNRISPVSAPQNYHSRPPYAYNLPAMSGPIMSNVHNPGNQMALVGGMNMQYPAHGMGGPMYGHHPQQQVQNERPFKCDQCPQSFNRNHDLKRHKRIHLAVKPFPCGHCEKSFSRKDALKRHILVKGCGKPGNSASNANGGSQSPVDKSEVMSDSTEGHSPEIAKKEI
ncbi:hypothetical protein BGZ60DRAFT_523842 [Tricladium varicosporioides]|nr:hypothetical protein BGZ60DRAFT_523842 [Hymenoscyphus varicosporioides]